MRKIRTPLIIVLVLAVCAILGRLYGPRAITEAAAGQTVAPDSGNNDSQIESDLRKFADVYHLVAANYAAPVNPSTAIYDGAVPGMLRQLDPHSSFWDPKAFAQVLENQQGRYSGVGMLIGAVDARNNQSRVVQPFEGTPAFKAGLRPYDLIMAVNGVSTVGMTTDQVATLLKGPRGTRVTIAVKRVGHPHELTFTMLRADVQHNSVDCQFQIEPGIVYIHLTGFTETSTSEMSAILDHLEANGGVRGVILDLRGNPGGLLRQAQGVAGLFLAKGQVIVSDHGRNSPEHVLVATRGNGGHDFPLVVLVNSMTASAAEIVSGSIQDHDRGLIVGQTTFGKGLVQTVLELGDGTGLALTTAHYYTPSGRLIQRPYEGVSLYDYFYVHSHKQTPLDQRQVKMTDIGRTVYGGGGITPDVQLPPLKLNDFQQMVLGRTAFYEFADQFLSKQASVPKNWKPDAATLQAFTAFLATQHVQLNPADVNANATWLKHQIRFRILSSVYGLGTGYEALMQVDPEVLKAVTLLPQAQALEAKAQRVLLAREAAGK
ncbi:MAG: S41 family peptidase [Terriglobales bacterium]